jgi:predicted small lipoprotein YifL
MKFHFIAGMAQCDEKRLFPYENEGDRFLPFGRQRCQKTFIASMAFDFDLIRRVKKVMQNFRRLFHSVIITWVCCAAMTGCGHKTDPVYVPDTSDTQRTILKDAGE